MNVLLISPLPPPAGGIASWTKNYMESKKAKEHNVAIVNTAVTGKRVKEYNRRNFYEELKRAYDILSGLKKQLKQNDINVVHLNSSCGRVGLIRDYLCAIAVKKNKVKLITHFHCDVTYMVDRKTALFFFKRLVKETDIVLTLNEGSKNFTYINCNINSITIPNFVPDEYINSIPIDKEINDNIKTILFVGHVLEIKGCDVIYEAAKLFPEIQFVLLGLISNKFKNMAKPSNIYLFGEVSGDQVKTEMLKADLLLFPTHTEGFPNVVIEAMACGLPIISTPAGAIPEMIEKNGGILVPINDVDAVAKAISVLHNKDLRNEMAHWNRQKVKNYYTTDKVVKRIFEIYKSKYHY
ncbi:MAG: glycosyltransferase family 4 protein [Eubacteriales bacterium]|nr:glycosyltransferase family 4 protein [Eubacteriales bacterium]